MRGLVRKLIEMAMAGDTTALRLAIERLAPPRRERPVRVELPKLANAADAAQAVAALVASVSLRYGRQSPPHPSGARKGVTRWSTRL